MKSIRLPASTALFSLMLAGMTSTSTAAAGGQSLVPLGAFSAANSPVVSHPAPSYRAGPGATNPQTGNSWSSGSSMPATRAFLATATMGSRTYSIGGCESAYCKTVYATNQAYNPATNRWTTSKPMPKARGTLVAAVGKNASGIHQIYAIGGTAAPCCGGLQTNEAYNPSTNSWTAAAPMPSGRFDLAAATGSNGLIYTFGGNYGTTTVEAYNPVTNRWTCSVGDTGTGCTARTITPMPEKSYIGAAAAVGDIIYVIVGFDAAVTGHAYAYNIKTNKWATLASMPTPRCALGAVAAKESNGAIGVYAIGGENANFSAVNNNEVYTPSTKSWSAEAKLPAAEVSPGIATMSNGMIQVAGGGNDSVFDGTNANQIYKP
ncbi:MAG: Kelch repeat-containing protein [Chloroflexota bacterium]